MCLLRRSVGGVRQCKRWMGLVTGSWGESSEAIDLLLVLFVERKRFYGHVRVYKSEDGQFGVQLDHRHLRTPLRQLFLVPFEPLALLAAQEWVGQVGVVKPPLMHVTSMCNTVLDNPRQLTSKQSVEDLIVFLESDTLRCVWACVCALCEVCVGVSLLSQLHWQHCRRNSGNLLLSGLTRGKPFD